MNTKEQHSISLKDFREILGHQIHNLDMARHYIIRAINYAENCGGDLPVEVDLALKELNEALYILKGDSQ